MVTFSSTPLELGGFELLNETGIKDYAPILLIFLDFRIEQMTKNRSTVDVERFFDSDAPKGTRTPVLALRGPRPRPLDDGGVRRSDSTTQHPSRQRICGRVML